MTTLTCQTCHDPLIIPIEPDSDVEEQPACSSSSSSPQTVPDDLLLPCGCHFHWQCFLDLASTIYSSLRCPSCNAYLPSESAGSSSKPTNPQILTTYTNEGGVQPSLDLYPTLQEEAYLAANPSSRPARAFQSFASEGDVQGMVSVLRSLIEPDSDSEDDSNTPKLTPAEVLTYRDPLNNDKTALHLAIENRQEEAVWALLWLGSGAPTELFPPAVPAAAVGLGLPRRLEQGPIPVEEDVRFVRDGEGRTAGDLCLEIGEGWEKLVQGGLFMS